MRGAIRWMAENHVAANLLMLLFVVGGLVLGPQVKQEVFPEVTLDRVQVSVAYPGAGPEEVEDGILRTVEERLAGLDGVRQLRSVAREGLGTVTVEVADGHDPNRVLQDVKNEVDRVTSFPLDAEKPIIAEVLNRREVVSLVVYGDLPERTLREHAEAVRDDLLALPGITQVELGGVRPYEISVEVPEEGLRRHGLTLDQVASRLRRASLDLPGGSVKAEGGDVLLRTKERRYHGPAYEDLAVLTYPDGSRVRLGDLARVRDGFRETDEFARFDDKPAAMVNVFRVGDQKPVEISDAVAEYVKARRPSLPDAVGLAVWNDTSDLFRSRRDLLLRNAALGLTLVFGVLGLFLQLRLALWVMLGIPISFLGALFVMPALGASINMISLFAFILALGIVVDDAIVVGENVFEHRQRGLALGPAAVQGAQEVGVPVTFSVLTTVAAFVPLLFVSGTLGKFIRVIPVVVISIFLVSLVESLFVLPAHLAASRPAPEPRGLLRFPEAGRRAFGRGLGAFVAGPYRAFLRAALAHRYTAIAAALALLLLTVGLVGGGLVRFRFMPEVDGDVITASLQMPRGTSVEETGAVQDRIVRAALGVTAAYDRDRPGQESVLRHVYAVAGSTLGRGGPAAGEGTAGGHLAEVALLLAPSERRGVASAEVAARWRAAVGELPGVESLSFTSNLVRLGANVDVRLAHQDFEVLTRATARLKQALAAYPGVDDVADTHALGPRELVLRLEPEAATLGVTEEDLGRQVRAAF
ncbi:MAG: efflux RND transporter permease subunit, partial [Deferrisomatales bacterium]